MSSPRNNHTHTHGQSGPPQCWHGIPAVRCISRQPHSFGRHFWCCSYDRGDLNHCRFFNWDPFPSPDDEKPGVPALIDDSSTAASSSQTSQTSELKLSSHWDYFPGNTPSFPSQFKLSLCPSFFKHDTVAPKLESSVLLQGFTRAETCLHLKLSPPGLKRKHLIIEPDREIDMDKIAAAEDSIDDLSDIRTCHVARASPNPRKKARESESDSPLSGENECPSPRSGSKAGMTESPPSANKSKGKVKEIVDTEAAVRHERRERASSSPEPEPEPAPAPFKPFMSAEAIEDM
ncbi:hypothetical protein B0F90DRAFT_1698136 [Multifurca ochricompacta]|uniref:GRF-type domain-containing protein n=1 Tax=Multifurca ochricompacta TaxID=376703 RepID=A0AAD4M8B4_9AGAM|nr:hypothetical protein B0F90DRAFT_1698136 [Multifurca ochricompacta]